MSRARLGSAVVVLAAIAAVLLAVAALSGRTSAVIPAEDSATGNGDDPDGEQAPAATRSMDSTVETGPSLVEPVAWRECGENLECGSVPVPLDYTDPDTTQLEIALVRVPANGDAVGSIFVNPGGPGASGVDFVRGGFRFDQATSARYDLVGFDPRGIGLSSPMTCTFDRDDAAMLDLSPDSEVETALLNNEAADLAADCVRSDGTVLPHLTTANVARDLDRLRQAVGDDDLDYYGLSYGTVLAVRYAQLFPETVGRMVLDGVVDPEADLQTLLRQQASAFEAQFTLLDERCDETPCPSDGITATFDRVRARLEADGPVDDVGSTELVIASLLPAYSPNAFPAYAQALDQADNGRYGAIEGLSDFFVGSISYTAYAAFACADGRPPVGATLWDEFAVELEGDAPRFGAVVANELRACAFWPGPADDAAEIISIEDIVEITETILVIGNTGDAATPLENAKRVATTLPNAHLVVLEAQRHTAYNGSACVREIVADYFADRLDSGSSRCPSDS